MGLMVFKVLSPAMMADPLQGTSPDPLPRYDGGVSSPAGAPVQFGAATVSGGTKVGDRWMGCTYIRPPYMIPGFGMIEELK